MPFQQDVVFSDEVGQIFGQYHSTFHSQTGQVEAQIFEQNGELVAHVRFPNFRSPAEVTDAYFSELNQYAAQEGFAGKMRIIYSE